MLPAVKVVKGRVGYVSRFMCLLMAEQDCGDLVNIEQKIARITYDIKTKSSSVGVYVV